jgi:hypothetical protein
MLRGFFQRKTAGAPEPAKAEPPPNPAHAESDDDEDAPTTGPRFAPPVANPGHESDAVEATEVNSRFRSLLEDTEGLDAMTRMNLEHFASLEQKWAFIVSHHTKEVSLHCPNSQWMPCWSPRRLLLSATRARTLRRSRLIRAT